MSSGSPSESSTPISGGAIAGMEDRAASRALDISEATLPVHEPIPSPVAALAEIEHKPEQDAQQRRSARGPC